MNRAARLVPALALVLAVTTACTSASTSGNGSEDSDQASVPEGMVLLETDIGSIAHPETWQPTDQELVKDQVASLLITDDTSATVGQMDVYVNEVPPGSQADALTAANQAARRLNFADLEQVDKDFVDVPGAASAFFYESTYTTAAGEPAHSIEYLAVGESGEYFLARISSAETAYDAELFRDVLDTMQLTGDENA